MPNQKTPGMATSSDDDSLSSGEGALVGTDGPRRCLFCPFSAPDGDESSSQETNVVEHCRSAHGFNAAAVAAAWRLDAYAMVRLVNFISSKSKSTEDADEQSKDWKAATGVTGPDHRCFAGEEFLTRGANSDENSDAWVSLVVGAVNDESDWSDSDNDNGNGNDGKSDAVAEGEEKDRAAAAAAKSRALAESLPDDVARAVQAEISAARAEVTLWKGRCHELSERLDAMKEVADRTFFADVGSERAVGAAGSGSAAAAAAASSSADDSAVADPLWSNPEADEGYFSSYASHHIHHTMLKDAIRTEAYRDFILKNADALFRDKVVLDIGCGTGILSMFAAKAGAKHVHAIDMSEIIQKARQIIPDNGFSGVITLHHGMAEKVVAGLLQEGVKVDVIISEWMGYFLLFESMLDSVVAVRDSIRALRSSADPELLVLPARCNISLACAALPRNRIDRTDFWDDVYGFRMKCMSDGIEREADVEVICADSLCSESVEAFRFDCNDVTLDELEWSSEFEVKVTRECEMDALVGWFDIDFSRGVSSSVCLDWDFPRSSLTLISRLGGNRCSKKRSLTSGSPQAPRQRRRTGSRPFLFCSARLRCNQGCGLRAGLPTSGIETSIAASMSHCVCR